MRSDVSPLGKNIPKIDSYDKVTGRTRYTADLIPSNALCAKVLHSTIANGRVRSIDVDRAMKVPGVIKIVTCFDVPDIQITTSGNPWTLDKDWQDIQDRKLLTDRVRYYGDDVAAVIAIDDLTAAKALKLIRVEYEEYKPCFDVLESLKGTEVPVHEEFPDNIVGYNELCDGDYEGIIREKDLICVDKWYSVPPVKHCHIENPVVYAYKEREKLIVVSGTQMPHVVRREVGQALGMPWGNVRVVRPALGGGFGNKDDALYEPLCAYLTTQVGGRPVKIELTREEDFVNTRTRHGMKFHLVSYVRKNGRIAARYMESYSNQGAYASHGHAIASKGTLAFSMIYKCEAYKCKAYTVYTNLPCAGAMRGYGMPQITFAMEAHTDDLSAAIGMDPVKFRRLNMMEKGFVSKDKVLTMYYDSLNQCLDLAVEYMNKHRKYKTPVLMNTCIEGFSDNKNYTDPTRNRYSSELDLNKAEVFRNDGQDIIRHGIGTSVFWYKTAVAPICLEASTVRFLMNQDGSFQMDTGELDLGQGSDTAFVQMAADRLHVDVDKIHIFKEKDTDVTPYGSGAYASRQTYVCGMAIHNAAELMCGKLLERAAYELNCSSDELYLCNSAVYRKADDKLMMTYQELAWNSAYDLNKSEQFFVEKTTNCHTNALSLGCCIAEVEVNIRTGEIRVINLVNAHDCGTLINPRLALAQVHGGSSMGLGYGLSEEMLFDVETGRVLNDNLLDYKLLTALDHPDHIGGCFVENPEPTSPFGTKALGEPPCVPTAPAIRNAVFDAVGVQINDLPLNPQRVLSAINNMRES